MIHFTGMTNKKMVSRKILIIEDERMLREALVENLVGEGYVVTGCESAEAAFKHIMIEEPDIILTDLVMANIDGFEVLQKLQSDKHLHAIPVLVLSNLGEKADVDRALSLGAKDFLVKSDLSLSEIADRVKKVLKKSDKR